MLEGRGRARWGTGLTVGGWRSAHLLGRRLAGKTGSGQRGLKERRSLFGPHRAALRVRGVQKRMMGAPDGVYGLVMDKQSAPARTRRESELMPNAAHAKQRSALRSMRADTHSSDRRLRLHERELLEPS